MAERDMSRIRELGDAILARQAAMGLENPRNFRSGITDDEMTRYGLFGAVQDPSEIHDLFKWKNGAVETDIPMERLWIKPGFFLLSAEDVFEENLYLTAHLKDWPRCWYPILTNCAGDCCFFDATRLMNGRVPVRYSFPESSNPVGQIYDSIERMFETILECYQKGVYHLDQDGCLEGDFKQEVAIARRLNPSSDYWARGDLY